MRIRSVWSAINEVVPGIDNTTISNSWLAKHIQEIHSPLGAVYPDVAYGMEGDTPSWLGLIPNGLNDPEHPNRGGWGGRYELYTPDITKLAPDGTVNGGVPARPEPRPIWTNASDSYTPEVASQYGRPVKPGDHTFTGSWVTLWRWRDDFQNDFAARMAWTVKPYAEANHPPVPALGMPDKFTVTSGATILLSATGSSDPDGDSLSYLWFAYPEAGTYQGPPIQFSAENRCNVSVTAPSVDKPQTIAFILKVTDKGSPPLTRYKRVTVTVVPSSP